MSRRRKPRSAGRPATARASAPLFTPPEWLPLALVLAGAAVVHAQALRAPFFADDYLFLDQVRDRGLVAALLSPDPIGNFLRPVGRQLHFWTWSHATGESPLAFHLVNVALFLGAVALLYGIARRVSGKGAATVAAAFLAFHYAADVPVLWASGSQDLLALAFGLAAILFSLVGRNVAAAAAALVALLSKETAAGVPILCLVAAHRSGEPFARTLRRQWPVLLVLTGWVAWWIGTLPGRGGALGGAPGLGALAATAVHGLQVALGLEWRPEDPFPVFQHPWIWLVLAAGGVAAWMAAGVARRSPRVWLLGAGLIVLGAAPVVMVATIWSAYFYILALAGAGLLLGALVGHRPPLAAAAVMALGLISANARFTDEFATNHAPWTRFSHVNRFYLERAMTRVARYLDELKTKHPTMPHRATLFFGNFPSFLGWQAGDGPLVRWAYRDSSLRSYYIAVFTSKLAARGPTYFFLVNQDHLEEVQDRVTLFQNLWYTRFLSREWEPARDLMEITVPQSRVRSYDEYWLVWANYALGDTARALELMKRSGLVPLRGPSPERDRIASAIAERDSHAAITLLAYAIPKHALDPELHAMTSDLLLANPNSYSVGALEAMLTTVLVPERPDAWRRLALAQLFAELPAQARTSLNRYYTMAGEGARSDPKLIQAEELIRRVSPGGDLLQKAIRK